MNRSTDARIAPTVGDASFNRTASEILRHCAELLRQRGANPFRVNAYLRAAKTLDALPTDAREMHDELQIDSLEELEVAAHDGDHREGQHTVVTETRGPFGGQRVVRGREAECIAST